MAIAVGSDAVAASPLLLSPAPSICPPPIDTPDCRLPAPSGPNDTDEVPALFSTTTAAPSVTSTSPTNSCPHDGASAASASNASVVNPSAIPAA